jgi:beta-lactam-binding protein with PASTA domain
MSFFQFIKSRNFLKHTLIAVILTILLMWGTMKLLGVYTRHGSSIDVPDFKGVPVSELDDFASDHNLEYVIIDSLYDYTMPKATVCLQDPAPGSLVKKKRKIYLTVVACKPEHVEMPNLIDLTLRQAASMLETYGLKAGSLTYVPDIAHNAVLKQKYKGMVIKEGTILEKGSSIDLVLGKGEDNENTSVPDLFGKKQSEVLKLLQEASLNIGNEVFHDGNDTTSVRVYKQRPEPGNNAALGSTIDVWYRSEKKIDFN